MIQAQSEVFSRVRQYVAGRLSLADLDMWIMEHIEEFIGQDDPGSDLALQVQILIAELNQGHRDETEIRQFAQGMLSQHQAIVQLSPVRDPYSSGNASITPHLTPPAEPSLRSYEYRLS